MASPSVVVLAIVVAVVVVGPPVSEGYVGTAELGEPPDGCLTDWLPVRPFVCPSLSDFADRRFNGFPSGEIGGATRFVNVIVLEHG